MDWGMKNRLSRIIKPETGRTVMLAVDHGYFMGPTHKLEEPRRTIEPLLAYSDAIMCTRGLLRTSIDPRSNVPIVLRVSGGASIIGDSLTNEAITTSVGDAVRLNAAAMALSIFIGTAHEHQTLTNLGRLVNEGEEHGIPVLAVTAVGKELEKRDARYLALACRIAAELGAHFVKTYYCEDFGKVVKGCPVPLVVAGGPKLETELDAFQLAYDAIQEGAVGVDMGRNIWQSDHPVPMIRAIREIVHGGSTVREAPASLMVGDKVTGHVDWERRHTLMKMHTAGHLLSSLFYSRANCRITGNQIDADRSRMDFNLESFDRTQIEGYVAEANELIRKDAPVKTYFLKREEALKLPDMVKLAEAAPPAEPQLRIVEIEGIDRQADGGLHVSHLKEIGQIQLLKLENKGKTNRRLYYDTQNPVK